MSPAPAPPELQLVDSVVLAATGSTVAREYSIADLPRIAEAGGLSGTDVRLTFRFAELDQHPAIHGVLGGSVMLACQRCLHEFRHEFDELFELVIVKSEEDTVAVPESHDVIAADPARLDLRWLAEEQVLLALPFAPKHASEDECRVAVSAATATPAPTTDTQRPFANLREMLGKH